MRGSPLVRSIVCALALAGAAFGLARITRPNLAAPAATAKTPTAQPAIAGVPFELVLSAPASEIILNTGTILRPYPEAFPITGKLPLDPANPHVALIVRWLTGPAAGERRFAKLTLEPSGQPTIRHVFDADGDINDVIEIPVLNHR